ncbi:hypothetical protein niasHS_009498 [Heterodera schachtii]|uniref:non-specific serine/threonine protein kinase n=1 Tax=Heterodera schachtii TaxID=97005 RepID=A0ABD2J0W1_HETSC
MHIKDKYVVLKQIGQGGFGRVYICENKYVRGKRYALKMIPFSISNSMASTSTAAVEHNILGKYIKDKYVVLKQIGQGGFGRVYFCENKYVRGQRYALKMIPMPKGGRHHHSVNPKAEIEIYRDLAKEKGRRFVKILDDFELDGTVFIVMESARRAASKTM